MGGCGVNNQNCNNCGGLILKPGITYGYAGPVCTCTSFTPYVVDDARLEEFESELRDRRIRNSIMPGTVDSDRTKIKQLEDELESLKKKLEKLEAAE
jgi:hypothetical protein